MNDAITSAATTSIGIFLFPEIEVLDFAGPFEVFTTASRVAARQSAGSEPIFRVFSVAAAGEPVRARAGLRIVPDFTFADDPHIDLLVIPGGVVTGEMEKSEVCRWIRTTAAASAMVASVCTGVFLLATAGVVSSHRVTTHWEDIAELAALFPSLHVIEGARWVDEGTIVTSGGISAGIDMSLHLVERLHSRELALQTARQMEFDWNPTT